MQNTTMKIRARSIFSLQLAFALSLLSNASHAQGNLVINGDFETMNPTAGWSGTYGNLFSVDPVSSAKEGRGMGGLFNNERLSQQLSAEPFIPYRLEFSLRSGVEGNRPVTVSWGSQTLGDFSNPDTSQWRTFRLDVTAETPLTKLSFYTTGPNWMIDAVSVTAVPEPTTVTLAVVAGVAMTACRRKRN
jgi:hypothetical protein